MSPLALHYMFMGCTLQKVHLVAFQELYWCSPQVLLYIVTVALEVSPAVAGSAGAIVFSISVSTAILVYCVVHMMGADGEPDTHNT